MKICLSITVNLPDGMEDANAVVAQQLADAVGGLDEDIPVEYATFYVLNDDD